MVVTANALRRGDCLGIFTASAPSYSVCEDLYLNGLKNLERIGFRIKEGSLTRTRGNQGYRSGTAEERAAEFMELILDPEVKGLIATIGGSNSSSLIPYLDFDLIRASRKVICGFSDITSLHMAILKKSGLQTFYGPAVMCWFGDWPDGDLQSIAWFQEATMSAQASQRTITAPQTWSNHMRSWTNGDWKNLPREWKPNDGWKILQEGEAEGPILAFNLNTLLTAAGTDYWPDLTGCVLLLEDMDAPQSRTERHLRQLSLMGAFDQIKGLIVSKPEVYNGQMAPFSYADLIKEQVGPRPYPIVIDFDCGHTLPMITIPQRNRVRLIAHPHSPVSFTFLERAVTDV